MKKMKLIATTLFAVLFLTSCGKEGFGPANNINPTQSNVQFVMTLQESQYELNSMATGVTEEKSSYVSYSDIVTNNPMFGPHFEVEFKSHLNKREGFQRQGYLIPMVVCDWNGNPIGGRTELIHIDNLAMLSVNRVYPVVQGQAQYSNVRPKDVGDYGIMALETSTNLTVGF